MEDKDKQLNNRTDEQSLSVGNSADGVAENADVAGEVHTGAENTPAAENAPEAVKVEGVPTDSTVAAESLGCAESAEEAEAKRRKKKRLGNIFWNIFLVIIIVAGIITMFGIVNEIGDEDGSSFIEVMRGASPVFCVALVGIVLLTMILDVTKYCIISKTVTGKFMLRSSVKLNFVGRYYDAVTPFATGGQPMQIYYLNSKGVSGGNATAIILIRYFSTVMCWVLLGCALMIVGTVNGVLDTAKGGAEVLKITGWIGIGINLIVPTFIVLFLILPNFMQKLTVGVVKLGHKVKIVKDVEKTTKKATKVVTDFKSSFKIMATSPLKLILLIVVSLTETFCMFSAPYFVMKAFSCNVDGMLWDIMALAAFAVFGVSFIPTPGNAGVLEGMGALAFSAAAGHTLAWSVLTWRFSTFYIYILVGLFIAVYDIIKKNVMNKRALRK